jgi:hypothetical protein
MLRWNGEVAAMTRSFRALTVVVGFLVIAGLCVDAEQTPSCTIFVQPGQSIQAAINDAPEGAVICLADGGWVERLTIEKSLTLRGASATTICSGEPDRILISVRRPVGNDRVSVVLDGLRLIGFLGEPALGARGAATVTVGGGAEVVIANCAVSGSGFGVNLWNSSTVTMTDCTITGNQVGVQVEGWAKAMISGCTVSKNRDTGIQVYGATVEVTSCTLAENEYGLRSSSLGGVTLTFSRARLWRRSRSARSFTMAMASGSRIRPKLSSTLVLSLEAVRPSPSRVQVWPSSIPAVFLRTTQGLNLRGLLEPLFGVM